MDLSSPGVAVRPLRLPRRAVMRADAPGHVSIEAIRRALWRDGAALLTLRGVGDAEVDATLLRLVSALGTPRPHDAQGRCIWDVRIGGTSGSERLAVSHTGAAFAFHTDASYEPDMPGYFALYAVQGDRLGGGLSLVVPAGSIIDQLSPRALRVLSTRRFALRVPLEFRKSVDTIHTALIGADHQLRYRGDLIVREGLDARRAAALAEFEAVLADPAHWRRLSLASGQLLLLDNRRHLHARTRVLDPRRHLKRLRFDMAAPAELSASMPPDA